MNRSVGLWIDHKHAVIVPVNAQGASLKKIESGAKHVEYRGGMRTNTGYGTQYGKGEDQLDNQYLLQLKKYYQHVISALRAADSILIFGPGEAKVELKKRLAGQKGRVHSIRLEPADRMTDRQIVARVRKHFGEAGLPR